ncbi:DUF3850 domain-containing protein [Patescibacteria group bacterium]|nr:MAG: DUF3850 domain-containing protein [Patescibacteria group bacterium]
MKIEKKIQQWSFDAILDGSKNFELRLADWECQPGDILVLLEIDEKREYTGRVLEKEVGYVLRTKEVEFFTPEEIEKHGFQIISLR